jgi:hypothetical protein
LKPTTLSDFRYMSLFYAHHLTPDKEIPPLVVVLANLKHYRLIWKELQ